MMVDFEGNYVSLVIVIVNDEFHFFYALGFPVMRLSLGLPMQQWFFFFFLNPIEY